MIERRIRIAVGMMLGILSLMGGAQAVAAMDVEIHYLCEGDRTLTVLQSQNRAEVRLDNRTFRLSRRAASLGDRFSSIDAALAVDDRSAIFIAGDDLLLRECTEASRTEASR